QQLHPIPHSGAGSFLHRRGLWLTHTRLSPHLPNTLVDRQTTVMCPDAGGVGRCGLRHQHPLTKGSRVTGDLVQRIAASVDRTYNAGTARFRWRMPAEGEWLGLSTGAVDFRAGRLAMRSRFAMPGSAAGAQGSPAGDQDGSTQIVTTHSVVSGGVLYTLQGPEESTDSQFWIAIELGSEGLAATPVGMLAWLRGATTAEATDPTAPAAVVVNVPRAIERAPKAEQAMLRQAWESARVGLSDATIAADVVL